MSTTVVPGSNLNLWQNKCVIVEKPIAAVERIDGNNDDDGAGEESDEIDSDSREEATLLHHAKRIKEALPGCCGEWGRQQSSGVVRSGNVSHKFKW